MVTQQTDLLRKHQESDYSFLRKGMASKAKHKVRDGRLQVVLTTQMFTRTNFQELPFLPRYDFRFSSWYRVSVPEDHVAGKVDQEQGFYINVSGKNGFVWVKCPHAPNPFAIGNFLAQRPLHEALTANEQIPYEKLFLAYGANFSGKRYVGKRVAKHLTASLELPYPGIENVVADFFQRVDWSLTEYTALQNLHGTSAYESEVARLESALFKDLQRALDKPNIGCRLELK